MKRSLIAAVVAALLTIVPSAHAVPDFARTALNIIPSGQYGGLPILPQADDQARMYDGLTPQFDRVSKRDLRRGAAGDQLLHARIDALVQGATLHRETHEQRRMAKPSGPEPRLRAGRCRLLPHLEQLDGATHARPVARIDRGRGAGCAACELLVKRLRPFRRQFGLDPLPHRGVGRGTELQVG